MMKIFPCLLIAIFFLLPLDLTYGQGCSDAGVCTVNSFKPEAADSIPLQKNRLKAGVFYGSADYSISVAGAYLEYNRQINEPFSMDVRLTSLSQSGNDISVFGLSDLYLSANYQVSDKTVVTLGTKIPLTDGNVTKDMLPLPMDYQSSLGTFDLIAGVGFTINNLRIIAAFQQPLTQNSNEFLAENYPANSILRTFQTTRNFKRNGDIILRVAYPIKVGDSFKITPGLLPIYHLANDKFTDAAGAEQEIEGSQGLTLNGNLYFDYEINHRNALQLNLGVPFIVRDQRPDGLTRSFVVNLEYGIKF